MSNQEERYIRQLQLPGFGSLAQQKLLRSKILVIGAGGLGVPALQYLAGMGAGTIGIADGDLISLSNLHRQVMYWQSEVGLPKALVAAKKLSEINPSISVKSYNTYINPDNALAIIEKYDLVIDATDNFGSRYLINDACVLLGKPFIYGAIYQFEGHISVFNHKNGPTYRCLYPAAPAAEEIPDCNQAGVLGVVPGIVGMYQALEAVKCLCGIGENLSGSLHIFDFLTGSQYRTAIPSNPENKRIRRLQENYDVPQCGPESTLQVADLYNWYTTGKTFSVVDVREPHEFQHAHLEGARSVPMLQLSSLNGCVTVAAPLILICQTGSRSSRALPLLRQNHPGIELYNLDGGMQQWQARYPDKFIVI